MAGLLRAAKLFCRILLILRSPRTNVDKPKFMIKCGLHSLLDFLVRCLKIHKSEGQIKKSFMNRISVACTRKILLSLFPILCTRSCLVVRLEIM